MFNRVVTVSTVLIMIISYFTFPVLADESNQVQVEADDGETYRLKVEDIPGFKEYLAELPPAVQKIEKENLRAWVPDNTNGNTLIIGYACGIKNCTLNALEKKPDTEKWEGFLVEESAAYQESVMSPGKEKLGVVTSQQVNPEETLNTIYSLKVEPAESKMLTKIEEVTPEEIFNGNYNMTFQNLRFSDNENFEVDPIVQIPNGGEAEGPPEELTPIKGRMGEK